MGPGRFCPWSAQWELLSAAAALRLAGRELDGVYKVILQDAAILQEEKSSQRPRPLTLEHAQTLLLKGLEVG